ncbi:hypothetical protein QP028_03145 [Corynebacterium suedekumii]|nr:hypothetical protein QP028_03145 [Corynebacterium suedekumii]
MTNRAASTAPWRSTPTAHRSSGGCSSSTPPAIAPSLTSSPRSPHAV